MPNLIALNSKDDGDKPPKKSKKMKKKQDSEQNGELMQMLDSPTRNNSDSIDTFCGYCHLGIGNDDGIQLCQKKSNPQHYAHIDCIFAYICDKNNTGFCPACLQEGQTRVLGEGIQKFNDIIVPMHNAYLQTKEFLDFIFDTINGNETHYDYDKDLVNLETYEEMLATNNKYIEDDGFSRWTTVIVNPMLEKLDFWNSLVNQPYQIHKDVLSWTMNKIHNIAVIKGQKQQTSKQNERTTAWS